MKCACGVPEGTAPVQHAAFGDANSTRGVSNADREVVEADDTDGQMTQNPVRVLTVGDGDLSFSLALMRCYGGPSLKEDRKQNSHSMELVATVLPPLEEVNLPSQLFLGQYFYRLRRADTAGSEVLLRMHCLDELMHQTV
eukprot:1722948-Pleurochrysis_carterae.AAC.2